MWTDRSEDGAGYGVGRVGRAVSLGTAVLMYCVMVGLQFAPDGWQTPSVVVAVPALVSMAFPPPMIVASAVLAIGTRWAFVPGEPGRVGAAIGTSAVIAIIAALGVYLVHRREQAAAHLVEINSVAEAAQRAILRPPPPVVGPFRTAAAYRAAAQYARVGGDLYAVADTAFGVRALIGDVRGKGLDAVATAAVILGSFHEAAQDHARLNDLADRMDTSLRRHLNDSEAFATAFLVEIAADGTAHGLSCGHPPPLILRGTVVAELPVSPRPPLGLSGLSGLSGLGEVDDPQPAAPAVRLHPGDTLLLYTDGLTEARAADGTFYPLLPRLTAHLESHPDGPGPAALLEWLHRDSRAFATGGADDDAALLALAWPPDRAHPRNLGYPGPAPL
ncbi:PP2C family protein-serine/threonine phosphatase [Kitasatospora sp. NPDC059673]|uniref:PP2C family protein-serine/threonine phosphatase n=1 Tax=Kitasatospora sp. NPDC059673 TaxID=3346901 RepID=UPI0036ACDA6A